MVVATTTGGTSKQLAKLEKRVQDGNYYDAQQMYKTIHSRYMASKKYQEASELMESGAILMLKHGQVTCGTELALLLIESLKAANVPFDSSAIDRIRTIFNEFPRVAAVQQLKEASESDVQASERTVAAKTRVECCTTFLRAALRWSMDAGGGTKGAPELHDMLADYIWTQSPYLELMKVSQHFVRGSHPEAFAKVVVEFMNKCFPGEADLVIARAVLLQLERRKPVMGRHKAAIKRLFTRTPGYPLLHFIKFLLSTLERDALPLFQMLRQKYKPSLDRDSALDEYLDEIGERFYNLQPRNGMQGMLGDFMKMFATDS